MLGRAKNPANSLARLLKIATGTCGRSIAQVSFVKLDPQPDPIHGKPCARSSHGLSLVHEGRRLVLYGGEHVARTPVESNQALWVADRIGVDEHKKETWQWRCCMTPENQPQPPARIAHAQAAVDDQFVYVFGGRAGVAMEEEAMNDLWKLDTSSLAWTKVEAVPGTGNTSQPPERRSFHRMATAHDKSLYVFGGCGEKTGRLADLHRFNVETCTWDDLGASPLLRGRGGPSLLVLDDGGNKDLAVVAGFAGEETSDGHRFDRAKSCWKPELLSELTGLRPRSVSVTGSFPSLGLSVLFGGEVDPSDRGHEGAGGFENDVVLLDGKTAKYLGSVSHAGSWPTARGWSDGASYDNGNGQGQLYIFGGLSGDDKSPRRLDDLWRLEIQSE